MPTDELTEQELAELAAKQTAGGTANTQTKEPEKEAEEKADRRDYKNEAQKNAQEAQNLRERLRVLEAEKAEADKAKLSETDRLRLEREEAVKMAEAAKQEARTAKIESAAAKLGFIDTDVAVALVGNAEDITKALNALVKEKPYLIQTDAKGIQRDGKTPDSQSRSMADQAGKPTVDEAKAVFPALRRLIFPGQQS